MSSSQWNISGLLPGIVGPATGATDNQYRQLRLDKSGASVTTDAHARYYEATARGKAFACMNSAAQALSLTGTTTYTGMVIYNPIGSGVNFSLQTAMYLQTTISTGLGGVLLFSQAIATAVPTLTATNTSGSPFSTLSLSASGSKAQVGSSCTLATNPVFLRPLVSIPWITAVGQTGGVFKDEIAGEIAVPPGGGVGFVAITTALTGIAYISWEEVSI